MSDTSIIAYGDDYDMNQGSYRKQGTCWSRIGANICVCILTLMTILLAIGFGYLFYRQYGMGGLKKSKAQKPGSPSQSHGASNMFNNAYNSISDHQEDVSHSDSEGYGE